MFKTRNLFSASRLAKFGSFLAVSCLVFGAHAWALNLSGPSVPIVICNGQPLGYFGGEGDEPGTIKVIRMGQDNIVIPLTPFVRIVRTGCRSANTSMLLERERRLPTGAHDQAKPSRLAEADSEIATTASRGAELF